MTITGYQKKIEQAVPGIKDGKARRLAQKIAKRAQDMQAEFDFYESLRILGVISDPTAKHAAIHTLETGECEVCGEIINNIEGAAA